MNEQWVAIMHPQAWILLLEEVTREVNDWRHSILWRLWSWIHGVRESDIRALEAFLNRTWEALSEFEYGNE